MIMSQEGIWRMKVINGKRLETWLEELAQFGMNEQGGIDRSIGSQADLDARNYLKALWQDMKLDLRTDGIANLWATYPGTAKGLKPIAVGSHHDAVPNGGKFDGAMGVLMATEVLKTIQESGIRLRHPYTVVSFTAEEPNPFNLSTMGSRSITGKITQEMLQQAQDETGRMLEDAIRCAGGDIAGLPGTYLNPGDLAAFIECHIEQGRNLYDRELSVAVVSRITGIYREMITVVGEANHAGTTIMENRHDAQLGACELSLILEDVVKQVNRTDVVATVGKMNVYPNSANIISGHVELIMEIRTPDRQIRDSILKEFQTRLKEVEMRRGIRFERKVNLDQSEVVMDDTVKRALAVGRSTVQKEPVELVSMAGHDAVHMSGIGKTGMLFVQSVEGISHSNQEFTRMEDIEKAANALLQAVLCLDQEG